MSLDAFESDVVAANYLDNNGVLSMCVFTLDTIHLLCPTYAEFQDNRLGPFFRDARNIEPYRSGIDTCIICHDVFDYWDHRAIELTGSPRCRSHVFGASCILTWLQQNKNCPICRATHVRSDRARMSRPSGFALDKLRQDWRRLVATGNVPRDFKFVRSMFPGLCIGSIDDATTKRGIYDMIVSLWHRLWADGEHRRFHDGRSVSAKFNQSTTAIQMSDLGKAAVTQVLNLLLIKKEQMIRDLDIQGSLMPMRAPTLPSALLRAYVQILEDAFGPTIE